jgi:hypothetical protein
VQCNVRVAYQDTSLESPMVPTPRVPTLKAKLLNLLEFLAITDGGQVSLINIGFGLVLFKLLTGPTSSPDFGVMLGVIAAHMHSKQLAAGARDEPPG